MTLDAFEREDLRRRIVANRVRIRAKRPFLADAEIDRRARLKACFPRGRRVELAELVGLTTAGLKMIVQGHRRASLAAALRICECFPDVLALEDLVSVPDSGIPPTVNLLRIDLAPWAERNAA